MKVLVFGMGYVAGFVKAHLPLGTQIAGTSRDPQNPLFFDGTAPLPEEALSSITHCLISIPPVEGRDVVLQHHGEILKQIKTLEWVGYLSAISVYGDHDGAWVTEESDCRSITPGGRDRKAVEELWQASQLPVHIFRLGSIYGPGRSVFDRLEMPKILAPGHFFSRMHVTDIARLLVASMERREEPSLYNIADTEPAAPNEVVDYAFQLLNRPSPPGIPLEEASLSPAMQGFYRDRKKVDGSKILKKFGMQLQYPTYREGLASMVAELPPRP